MDAYNAFAQSPTKLQEILGENDDGSLSSALQTLAESIRNPDQQLNCNNLKTWIQARVDDRLARFDLARRSNHVEEMQIHAAYVCKHKRGVDVLCSYVAKLAMRPLLSASRSVPVKDDIPLLFDQIRTSMIEGRGTIMTALEQSTRAASKYVDKVVHLILGDDAGLKALVKTWFPSLESPPPGIALERCEMLAITRTNLDTLLETFSNEADIIDLKARASRLFELVSHDYYALEISLLEHKFKTGVPDLPQPGDFSIDAIDLERLMMGKCKAFIEEYLHHAEQAYARASAFLQDDALEICLETLVSCASSRVIDAVVLVCCKLSSRICSGREAAPSETKMIRSSPEASPVHLLKRSLSSQNALTAMAENRGGMTELPDKCRFLSEGLIPFVEFSLDILDVTHSFCESGSAIHGILQTKISAAEEALEAILSHVVDDIFAQASQILLLESAKSDLEKGESDTALNSVMRFIKQSTEEITSLGEGTIANLALATRELVLMRIGLLKKVSANAGQTLARELSHMAGEFDNTFENIHQPENRVLVNRISAEIRQLGHLFMLAREDVTRGSAVMDRIPKDLALECLNRRSY